GRPFVRSHKLHRPLLPKPGDGQGSWARAARWTSVTVIGTEETHEERFHRPTAGRTGGHGWVLFFNKASSTRSLTHSSRVNVQFSMAHSYIASSQRMYSSLSV